MIKVDTVPLCSRLMTGQLGPDHLVTDRTWRNSQRIVNILLRFRDSPSNKGKMSCKKARLKNFQLRLRCYFLNLFPPMASSVKDLGVHLSTYMKCSLQATIAAQNANKMANRVLSVFSDRSKDVLLTLCKSIVRSRIEYSCPVWNTSSMQDIKKLEFTKRAFTHYISACQGLSSWSPGIC